MYVLLSALPLLLMIGALADIITMDQSRVKHLPKFAWILLVILLPLVGSILWFIVGRDYAQAVDRGGFGDPRRRETSNVGDGNTEAQIAALNREIAAHERTERIRHLEEELEAKRREKEAGS